MPMFASDSKSTSSYGFTDISESSAKAQGEQKLMSDTSTETYFTPAPPLETKVGIFLK